MKGDRRRAQRFAVGFYTRQVVDDVLHRCFTTNLSATGIYLEQPPVALSRRVGVVQLEIPLPGIVDTLWAKGEVIYDSFDGLYLGTAVHFTAMARGHRRALREWLDEVDPTGEGCFPLEGPCVSVIRPQLTAALA